MKCIILNIFYQSTQNAFHPLLPSSLKASCRHDLFGTLFFRCLQYIKKNVNSFPSKATHKAGAFLQIPSSVKQASHRLFLYAQMCIRDAQFWQRTHKKIKQAPNSVSGTPQKAHGSPKESATLLGWDTNRCGLVPSKMQVLIYAAESTRAIWLKCLAQRYKSQHSGLVRVWTHNLWVTSPTH